MTNFFSNTVRVTYPVGECPTTVDEAAEKLASFGDIARMDTSLAAMQSSVLVTFFDVRSAQRLLLTHPDTTESFANALHDVRVVRASSAAFAENVGTEGLLHKFGGAANVSTVGESVVIEFFDMRSAQLFLSSVRGAVLVQPDRWAQPKMTSSDLSLARAALLAEEGIGSPERKEKPERTAHMKVGAKEFQRYDISAQKIRAGLDTRTTVMVRNLSGPNARTHFLNMLELLGLQERYTFFYMPYKEFRSVHAGFAFVNFCTAKDVLQLFVAVQRGLWKEIASPDAKPLRMSYARFQGQQELQSHFNSSAVLHDQDPQKRPVFRDETNNNWVECPPGLDPSAPVKVKNEIKSTSKLGGAQCIMKDVAKSALGMKKSSDKFQGEMGHPVFVNILDEYEDFFDVTGAGA
jgi:hypothetical protein